jgi:hypothetical protein
MPIKVCPSVSASVLRSFSLFVSILRVTDTLNGVSRSLVKEDFTEDYKVDREGVWMVIVCVAYLNWSDLAAT